MIRTAKPAAAVLLLSLFLPSYVLGQKTDVVVLENGDHLTGEVKRLERGKLVFKTDSLGTVEIEWDDILSVTSAQEFEVELETGERFFGSLGVASDSNEIVVELPEGPMTRPHEEVVLITPIKSTFWGRVDGSLDLGFSYAQADKSSQLNLGLDASIRSRKYLRRLQVSSILSNRDEGEDVRRSTSSFEFSRFISRKWDTLAIGSAEQNEELGLDIRTTLSAGMRRHLVRSNSSNFSALLAAAVNRELYLGSQGDQYNLEAVAGLEYEKFSFDDPEVDFTVKISVFPSLSESGRVRVEFESRLRRELVEDFFLVLSIYDSFDSDPPVEEVERNDWGLTTSLGWSF